MRKPILIKANPYKKAIVIFSFDPTKKNKNPKSLFKNIFNKKPFNNGDTDYYKTYIESYFDGTRDKNSNDWEGRTYLLGGHCIILINEYFHSKLDSKLVNTVAHEAVHVFNDIANNINLEVNYHGDSTKFVNDEHQAYFIGWLSEEIYKYMETPKLK
jgi:hypothetical protein